MNMSDVNGTKRSDTWGGKMTAVSSLTSAAASVLAVLVAILQKDSSLPSWFIYIPAILLLVSLGVLIYKPMRLGVKNLKSYIAARACFRDLMVLTTDLQALLERQRTDSITNALLTLQAEKDWVGSNLISDDFEQYSIGVLFHLQRWLENCHRTADRLAFALNQLTSLTLACERAYFEQSFQKIRSKGLELLPDHNKSSLNLARENFASFLRRFVEYRRKVSQKLGDSVVDYYLEIPKQL